MTRAGTHVTAAIALALLGGCAGDDITGTPSIAPLTALVPTGTADVSGAWLWSNAEEVSFPRFLAMLLGVVPEGDLTHGRCESAGSMTLNQAGATFDGTAMRLLNSCITEGGQPFSQPGTAFDITDGRITGASIRFSFASETVTPCPHHARITALHDGAAVALSGKGRCILPGHPRSESPLQADPPPQGRSRTTLWEAVRP